VGGGLSATPLVAFKLSKGCVMANGSELIKKIFLEIMKNPKQKGKVIYVVGYNYDSEVFPQLISLHKDGYIFAKLEKDESGSIVQIFVDGLTQKGEKYYRSLAK